MNTVLYEKLKQVAQALQFTSYGEMASLVGMDISNAQDRSRIAQALDEINEGEVQAGRPMLSAVVVQLEGGTPGHPGAGFLRCARRLGLLESQDNLGEIEFWIGEVRRVYQYWESAVG